MAPDKIVIMDGEIHRTEQTYINDIEYIRKDALLEWARNSRDSAGKLSYTEFIEKIETL